MPDAGMPLNEAIKILDLTDELINQLEVVTV
jgi:hypothetical protein